MQNSDKIAVAAFANATVSPSKYSNGIYALLADPIRAAVGDDEEEIAEEQGADEPVDEGPEIDLEPYLGTYTGGLGGNETAVVRWRGSIGTIGLPTDNPSVRRLQHVEGDTFRRVGSDGDLGQEVIFDRDEQGRVVRMRTPLNYRNKVRGPGN